MVRSLDHVLTSIPRPLMNHIAMGLAALAVLVVLLLLLYLALAVARATPADEVTE